MIPSQTVETPVSLSLIPYNGAWTEREAGHLLRRTLFGATYQQIQTAVTDGLATTISNLLTYVPVDPPIATLPDETIAAFGTTWITSVYPADEVQAQTIENARNSSLGSWLMQNINLESFSITEKMSLFWQNHFAAENTFDSRATYNYHQLIRTYCLGNFKEFLKKMAIDPSMLFFLNGVSNQSFSPNENFARELLELYSIGKGPQVAEGDYTNYTEEDVAAGAKIFTGWTVDGMRSTTITSPVAIFNPDYHNQKKKKLSNRFGNIIIEHDGVKEYENYIDVIFQQPATAKFICTKLYRYFVNYDITDEVKNNVISEMAATFIAADFEIKPVLEQLFKSEHFYDVSLRGTLIKNPLELIFSMVNTSQSKPKYDIATNQEMYLTPYYFAGSLGQAYGKPPNVGGWPAYYQTPSFSRLWINSTYLKLRFQVGYYLTIFEGVKVNGHFWKADALTLVNSLSSPSNPTAVIDDLCIVFLPKEISDTEKGILKGILVANLPDFEWTVQYNEYISDPENKTNADVVRTRIELVLFQLFQMPEFQTI